MYVCISGRRKQEQVRAACQELFSLHIFNSNDKQTSVVDATSSGQAGSFTPPATWKELSDAVIDLMMPGNSVEECALRLASLKKEKNETVSNYASRFRSLPMRSLSFCDRMV